MQHMCVEERKNENGSCFGEEEHRFWFVGEGGTSLKMEKEGRKKKKKKRKEKKKRKGKRNKEKEYSLSL